MWVRLFVSCAVASAITTSPLVAQQPPVAGTRIRLTVPSFDATKEEATVVEVRPETLVVRFNNRLIRPKTFVVQLGNRDAAECPLCPVGAAAIDSVLRGGIYAIPDTAIRLVEISAGHAGNRMGDGAKTGALTGALLGVVVGLASGGDPPCEQTSWCFFRLSAGSKALGLGLLGTIPGVFIGSVIGAFIPAEIWQPAPGWSVSPKVRVTGGRANLGISLSF